MAAQIWNDPSARPLSLNQGTDPIPCLAIAAMAVYQHERWRLVATFLCIEIDTYLYSPHVFVQFIVFTRAIGDRKTANVDNRSNRRLLFAMIRIFAVASIAVMCLVGTNASAETDGSIFGRWMSASGRGIIEIYHCADKLCGRIVWLKLVNRDGEPVKDIKNSDPQLQQRPLCGMNMLGNFHQTDDSHWEGGWIYNPENGETYSANIALESANVLKLRGYIGISLLGETQTWARAASPLGSCDNSNASHVSNQ